MTIFKRTLAAIAAAAMLIASPALAQTTRLQVNPSLTTSQVALSTTAAVVLAAGPNYVSRSVCNLDATIIIYIGVAGVTASTGFPVYPKTCTPPELLARTTAAVSAVAASGTPSAAALQY